MDVIQSSSRDRWTRRGLPLSVLAVLAALLAAAAIVDAHTNQDHGEITLQDEAEGPRTTEVRCEFWVHGHGLSHEEVRLVVEADESAWNGTVLESFRADSDGTGMYAFEAGPFRVEEHMEGSRELYAEMNETSPPMDQGGHATGRTSVALAGCSDGQETREGAPACSEQVYVDERADGTIELAWEDAPDAEAYTVKRAEGGIWTTLATTNGTVYEDSQTNLTTTYQYQVLAENEHGRSHACPVIEASASSVLGAPALIAAAVIGGSGVVAATYKGS